MRGILATAAAVLALLGIAISAEHFLGADHYDPGFAALPAIIGAHVVAGAVYLACGLAQFFRSLREGWPAVHRATGRVAIVAGSSAA